MKQYVYADNAATTKMDKVAYEAMVPYFLQEYGNASQPYAFSRTPKKALQEAREVIASCIGAFPDEIFFTSGGTESSACNSQDTEISHILEDRPDATSQQNLF